MHTTKQFADTLEQRTQNLRSQQERRQKVTGSRHSTVQTPVFQPEFGMFNEKEEFNDSEVVIPVPLMQSYEDTLILQRVDDVKEIEEQMKKVHAVFQKLAEYVQMQGETIRRIEDRIDETVEHSQAAHVQLLRAYENLSNDRKMMLKGFGLLLFFIFAFLLFFA